MYHDAVELTVGVEVRGVETAVVALQRGEHRVGRDAGLLTLGHIDVQHILRVVGVIRGLCRLELRPLVEFGQVVLDDAEELVKRTAGTVLHHDGHTGVGRETGNHRRCEGQNLGILDMGRLDIDLGQHAIRLVGIEEEAVDAIALPQTAEFPEESLLALGKRLQLDDERSLVGTGTGNEVVTLNLLTALDGRVGSQDAVHLTDDALGALHRRGRRHGDGTEDGAGILVGHQARLGGSHRHHQHNDADDDGKTDGQRLLHQFLHYTFIFISGRIEGGVERGMEAVYHRHLLSVSVLVVGFQEDGTQGGRQRQGVQRRDEDADSHRHTKLTVERAGGAAYERHGDEHRGHHQRDRDDSTRNLIHGIDRGRQRRLVALVELGVYGLYHHDSVVHHNGDGQQQRRQRQQVDGETEDAQEEERTHQRHRHGNQRDERRAPVLQEDVNHDEHQYQREQQREHHLLDRGVEELRDVVVYLVEHTRGHQLLLGFQLGLHLLGYLVGVGAGNLLHHTHDRRDVVVLHRHGVLLTAKFYACHVLEFQRLSVGVALDDDVAKLLGTLQTTGVAHGVLVLHVALLSERARRSLDVLFGQHTANVRRHQVVLLHHVGLQPDTHRVGLQTRRLHVTNTLNTLDGRDDVDVVVVRQELVVVATVRGQREHQHLRRLALRHRHTDARHLGRQQGLGLRHAVLHVDGTHIGVHALAEQHRELRRTGRGGRRDVVHAFHTVDAFFQRRDDGVLHRLGVSTRVTGPYGNGRRCYIGVLLDRQRHQPDEAQQDYQDGDHRREHRSFDKGCKSHIFKELWSKELWSK